MAAIRELEEETGLKTTVEHLHRLPEIRNTVRMKNGTEDFIFQLFLCAHYSGKLRSSEKTVPEFIDLDFIDKLVLVTDDIKDIAREWYDATSRR